MLRTNYLHHFALLFGSSLALTLALFGGLGGWSIALGAPSLCVEPTGAGGCFTTIASAVTAAASGDTISIHAGTYYENVNAGSKSLTFKGDGRSATIVDGGNNGRVFQVSNGFNLALYDLTVRNGNGSSSSGGGIYMGGSTNLLTLVNVDVLSNTAGAKGGGAYSYGSATISNTNFISNTAGTSSAGSGAGLFTEATLTVTGGLFERNVSYGSGDGGGLAQNGSTYTATITGTQFYSNTANRGGGAYLGGSAAAVEDAYFQGNQAATAIYGGGAVYAAINGSASLKATNVDAFNNMAINGGAIYANRDATISGGRYINNMGDGGSGQGGALYAGKAMTVTDAQIFGNTAYQGGGIMQYNGGLKVSNTLLARNTASFAGAALYLMNLSGTPAQIVNSTIATPTASAGIAIYSLNDTFYVTNTLISGYSTGIQRSAGSPAEDYNLFAQVTTQTSGSMTRGGHSRATSNARFVDPANDDYHLLAGSGAAARGINAGVTLDMDGTTRPDPPSIGAYEGTALPGDYAFTNTASVTSEVPYKGVVTYTLVLTNSTAIIDSSFRVTDVLPTGVTFKQWSTKPTGAWNTGGIVTYTGSITDSTVLTLSFLVTNTTSGGAVITNTAVFTGTDAAGSATAVFGATTTECVASQSNGWSLAFASCILPDVKKVIPPPISVTLDRSTITLTGDLEVQAGGALIVNTKTLTLTGSHAQTLTGSSLTFYNLVLDKANKSDAVTIAGKLKVTKKLTIAKGSLVSASEYGDLDIQDEGVLTLTNPISITGSFTNSGDLNTEGFAVNFTGGIAQPVEQRLALNVMTWFDDLNVLTGTTLVEAVTDDNAYLTGALTNYGTIRKTQPIAAATTYYFGLAGKYAGSDLEVDATAPGTLTSLQVDRFDAAPANPPAGKTTPIYWAITPLGSGYTVNLMLPHNGVSTPGACRRVSGNSWNCGRTQSDATTVTRSGVTQFSDWAVFALQPSTTALTAGPNPSVLHAPVVFTATVAPAYAVGSVQFYADGLALGSAQPIAGGTAVLASTALALGTHVVTATAAFDVGPYAVSTGTLVSGQTVNRAESAAAVVVSANPAANGQALVLTATVAAAGTEYVPPTGVVSFSIGASQALTAAVNAGKQAVLATTAPAAGTYPITATYSGDASYLGSAGTLPAPLVVDKACTAAVVETDKNPTVFGETAHFTATISAVAPGAGTPTGVITFTVNGQDSYTATLDANGAAGFATSALDVGDSDIAVAYGGDANFKIASGGPVTQTVDKANTGISVSSSVNPSSIGQPIVLTATVVVSAPGAGIPTGVVTFTADGDDLGSGILDANGVATYATAALLGGTHVVTSTYGGDANFNSGIGTLAGGQVVSRAGTSTALTGSPNPTLYGQVVVFTATVTTTAPGAGIPEGAVAFSVDGDPIDGCEAVVTSGAVAACTTDLLAAGTHTVTAEYAGSANYLGSTAPGYYQVVTPLPVAVNDAGGTLQETPVTLTVLANDLDPAGGGLLISAITLLPVHGTAEVAPGSQTVRYTPETGFSGQDSFVYVATDANGNSDDALVTVMVTAKSQTAEPPQVEPVNPEVDANKEFTSPAANVEVQLPANFYTDTLSEKEILFLSYTPVVTATEPTHTPPGNLKFGNFEFDLTLFRNNEPQHNVQFEAPLTVTIAYDPAMLNGLREDLLDVYFWNGTEWSKDGVTVLGRDLANHTVTFLLAHLSHFGFFSAAPTASDPADEPAGTIHLYLPGVLCQQQGAAESPPAAALPEPAAVESPVSTRVYLPSVNR